jgi:hypothetical protein
MKCYIQHNDTEHNGSCAVMMNVVMLNVANKPFMLSVIKLNVVATTF